MESNEFDRVLVGLEIVARLAKAYQGIEEITDPDDGEDVIDGGEKTGQAEIEEVIDSSEDVNAIDGGRIFFRNGITIAILSMWTVWNLIGLIQFVITGSAVLLLTSPAVWSVSLHKVLGYLFRG